MTHASGRVVDRRGLERMLDQVIVGQMSLKAFADWIERVLVAEKVEVDEKDNAIVWMVIYWLSDCIDEGGDCDLLTLVERYRKALAAAPANKDAETLMGLAGARDILLDYLRRLTQGKVTREQYGSAIDSRELWPPELRELMKSIPDHEPLALITAFEQENYRDIARLLRLS